MKKDLDFFQAVYQIVRLIPPGKVTTYGAIAQALGSKGAARMVGWAMNASHSLSDVPAHRVVNRTGLLTGKMHFEDEGAMQRKLMAEGIPVLDDQIQQFESFFWDPKELG
ncbi:MAG: MGMT family protein [Cryomorphaceae bacterium]|jgi:methylated-DNA-protein-cysteine methyltransferase-like protein|nr:MGMT family protein [Cryomorphaceae bacterium]